jgi:hypothetical protein
MSAEDDLRVEVLNILTTKISQFAIQTTLDPIEFVLEVEEAILNYCNLDYVPAKLKYTWANMALDLLRWTLAIAAENTGGSSGGGGASVSGDVSSIQSGDTTVSFSSSSDSSSSDSNPKHAHSIKSGVDGIVLNYADQLNRFRRVVWG